MTRVFVKYLPPKHPEDGVIERLERMDASKVHSIAPSADEADMVLFVKLSGHGPFFTILFDPLYRQFRKQSFLFCSGDLPLHFLPGLFPSLRRRSHSPDWALPFHYIHGPQNDSFDDGRLNEPTRFLYSFVGNSGTSPIRKNILSLAGPDSFILDTKHEMSKIKSSTNSENEQSMVAAYRRQFADALYQSDYVLCPRGFGTSSFRIFEAMRCGRVPVIISDDWVEPAGPDWPAFSLRIAEKNVDTIPQVLQQNPVAARSMGQLARSSWEEWCSPAVSFHRLVETLNSICVGKSRRQHQALAMLHSLWPTAIKGFAKEQILRRSRW